MSFISQIRLSNIFLIITVFLLTACVGSGSQPGGGLPGGEFNGPVGGLGGGQQAAPEMDAGVPAPIVDHNPCEAAFEGEFEELEDLPGNRKKYRITGFIKIPIKETKTYKNDTPESIHYGETITKIECVGFRPAETGRVMRFALKNEKTFFEVPLQDKTVGAGEQEELRSGYVNHVFEGPAEKAYWAQIGPLDYAASQPGVMQACPIATEECIDSTGWGLIFLPPSVFYFPPSLKGPPTHLEVKRHPAYRYETIPSTLKAQPVEKVNSLPKKMIVDFPAEEDSDDEDSEYSDDE